MDLSSLLQSSIGQQLIGQVSNQMGLESNQTQSVVQSALPILLGALAKNSSTPEGAASLENALNKHDGSILDNISGLVGGGDYSDGNGILGHLLGGSQNNVNQAISQNSGVSAGQVGQILAVLAPVVLGYLGKQKQEQSLDSNGIAGLLGGAFNNFSQGNQQESSIVSSLLDQDKDGSVMDDVASMGLDLLGNFFKK